MDSTIGEDVMTDLEHLLSEALGLYILKQPKAELIRHNENMTYKITDADKKYVLRIHKRVEGFSTDIHGMSFSHMELVQGELNIISALKNGADILVQTPVYGLNGILVQSLSDGTPVTLLEWIEGQTVENAGMTPEILRNSGKLMAKIHSFFSQCNEIEKKYSRYSYDQSTLTHIADKIESAARVEAISNEQAHIILNALDEARRRFDELDAIQEKQIIHADLGKSNVIVGPDGQLTPIDFSLCGYSHFYMDIGGIYGLNHNDESRKHILERKSPEFISVYQMRNDTSKASRISRCCLDNSG
jgi:Ser/Thr protein kinase RdoA (MazF antagonist)